MNNIEAMQYAFGHLFLVSNRLQTMGDNILDALTLKQWLLLISVSNMVNSSPSITDIAEFMGSTRQNIRKMVTLLETKGYISTKIKQDDRRNLEVTLTTQTYNFFKAFEGKGNDILVRLFANINDDDLMAVNHFFQILLHNISEMENYYASVEK